MKELKVDLSSYQTVCLFVCNRKFMDRSKRSILTSRITLHIVHTLHAHRRKYQMRNPVKQYTQERTAVSEMAEAALKKN